uniref:Uncharacterized protein n=1 Tax=Cannabis sativa TaxID=3483 RepID=A0A803PH70_CANSA
MKNEDVATLIQELHSKLNVRLDAKLEKFKAQEILAPSGIPTNSGILSLLPRRMAMNLITSSRLSESKFLDLMMLWPKHSYMRIRMRIYSIVLVVEIKRPGWVSKTGSPSPVSASHPGTIIPSGSLANSATVTSTKLGITLLLMKRLTPAEMRDKRKRGICFTCDDKYSFGYKYKNRVMLLCGTNETEEEISQSEGLEAHDSEDNAMDKGHIFIVDLYILPIHGLDVVLGMQWMQNLGPCIHDHKTLTMEFS